VLRFLLWRLFGLLAVLAGLALIAWFIDGGPGEVLRGRSAAGVFRVAVSALAGTLDRWLQAIWSWAPAPGVAPAKLLLALVSALVPVIAIARVRARRRRRYVRLRVEAYRADQASAEAVVTMFGALHKRLLRRWWRRLLLGQPSLSLEVHHTGGLPTRCGWRSHARRGRSGWSRPSCRPPIRTAGCVRPGSRSACRRRCCG